MIGADNTLKISDFGISRILSNSKSLALSKHDIRTTFLYKAPEAFNKKERKDKIDIWGAGVILYFMLSLRYPFDGDDECELMSSIT